MPLINYLRFDYGDLLRLRDVRFITYPPPAPDLDINESVYKVVSQRSFDIGILLKRRQNFYVLERLDQPYHTFSIFEKKEIDNKIVAKRLCSHCSSYLQSQIFDIQIDIWGSWPYLSEDLDEEHIGNLKFIPTQEDFLLFCEEIHTKYNSLVNGRHEGYFPAFHERIKEHVDEWIEDHRRYEFEYRDISWRYSEETEERVIELIEKVKPEYEE